ncbi:phosphoacetylglucosamine mutase [Coffea eugenioides]|uniref:phosphoacetylglucosamine mutase n=1 Tax=Coffea eugenioides TaxID=49369 RepID=UPI000F613819|nr:phosphoacetylglucosamine mutase [Coffea eugenioides]
MNDKQRSILLDISSRFSPPQGVKLSYGTSGFRADASLLESTVYRVGLLAALRSLKTRAVIGLMITASHNKISDNGIKVADPSGGMLTQDWEPFAESLANAPDSYTLVEILDDFVKKEKIALDGEWAAEVFLGRDTRPSGVSLLEAAKQGVASIVKANAKDMGVLTTPQLHWMVRARNKGLEASEHNYFDQLSSSFRCLLELIPQGSRIVGTNDKLIVDGADGIGGEKLESLKGLLNGLCVEVRNSGNGVLNEGVGADYVQKEKVVPRGFGPADVGIRCASFDGDADRLVYFLVQPNSNKIELVDGDKIMALFALFLEEQLSILNKSGDVTVRPNQTRLGIVQTAYANGASTSYLKQLGLEVVFTPTGVKHLHEKAAEYDIGIYFEANGHGTVLFSEAYLCYLEDISSNLSLTSTEKQKVASRLLAVSKLINQAVGDALSGLLLVEAILQHLGWSIQRWNELYHDLPSRQLKVKVLDRAAVVTANAETVVVKPSGIQEAINAEIAKYHKGRCFIRPSGTEDVVRVYAEASTQEAADGLAYSVAKLADQFLGSTNS